MTLFFLGLYAAAQLNAGSKALHALFGWHHYTGALIGALIVPTILCCWWHSSVDLDRRDAIGGHVGGDDIAVRHCLNSFGGL